MFGGSKASVLRVPDVRESLLPRLIGLSFCVYYAGARPGQAREIGGMKEGNSSLVLVVGNQSENVGTERARCNVVKTRIGGRGFLDDNDSWPRSIPEALERRCLTTAS